MTWTAFAILAMFKICFKEDEAQSVVQRFFGQKQFKGTVPQIREVFFVSVNFFWFEIARGEFSRYFRVKYLYLRYSGTPPREANIFTYISFDILVIH